MVIKKGGIDGKDLAINLNNGRVGVRDDLDVGPDWEGYKKMGEIDVPQKFITKARALVEAQKSLVPDQPFIKSALSF